MPPEEEQKLPKEEHTQDQAVTIPIEKPVCVPLEEPLNNQAVTIPMQTKDKAQPTKTVYLVRSKTRTGFKPIPSEILDQIDRQVSEFTASGLIRNPGGYRATLIRAAEDGTYKPLPQHEQQQAKEAENKAKLETISSWQAPPSLEEQEAVKAMLRAFTGSGQAKKTTPPTT